MWRKSSEAKPNAAASNTPAPAPANPQETPQATSQKPESTEPVQAASVETATPATAPANGNPARKLSAPSAREPVAGGASTISAGLNIKGEVTGTSDLTIDGEVQGKVRLVNGRVTVGEKGRVDADIEAREIVVNGVVQGNLKASESVRLGPASHVEGSVLTRRIGIDDGARLRGNVEMIRAGEASDTARPEPSKATQAVRAASASAREE